MFLLTSLTEARLTNNKKKDRERNNENFSFRFATQTYSSYMIYGIPPNRKHNLYYIYNMAKCIRSIYVVKAFTRICVVTTLKNFFSSRVTYDTFLSCVVFCTSSSQSFNLISFLFVFFCRKCSSVSCQKKLNSMHRLWLKWKHVEKANLNQFFNGNHGVHTRKMWNKMQIRCMSCCFLCSVCLTFRLQQQLYI